MAVVTCPECNLTYDDVYRLTFCPHDAFGMSTHATRSDGATRVCTSIKELKAFMAGEIGPE